LLNLTFTTEMILVENPEENIDKQIFEIFIDSDFDYYDYHEMVIDWQTIKMTERYILIQVELQNEDQISVFETPDKLRVVVKNKKFFMTQSPN